MNKKLAKDRKKFNKSMKPEDMINKYATEDRRIFFKIFTKVGTPLLFYSSIYLTIIINIL